MKNVRRGIAGLAVVVAMAWVHGSVAGGQAVAKDDAGTSLVGTTWSGTDSDGDHYVFTFENGGTLAYTSPSGSFTNGTWNQFKNSVCMEMNNHVSDYLGSINGSTIEGKAWNHGQKRNWTWTVKKEQK